MYIKKKNSKGMSYKGRGGVFFIIHVQMALVCKKKIECLPILLTEYYLFG